MYHTLIKVVMRNEVRDEQGTKHCEAKEPQLMKLARGGQEP
jgi:hypothetical protein